MKQANIKIDLGDTDIFSLEITAGKFVGTLNVQKKGLTFESPGKEESQLVDWEKLRHFNNGKV